MKRLQDAAALLLGVTIALGLGVALVIFETQLFPAPTRMDFGDAEQVNAYLATLPWTAFVLLFAVHLSQALAGGFVAASVATSMRALVAFRVGLTIAAVLLVSRVFVQMPSWMLIEVCACPVLAGYAGLLESRRRTRFALDQLLRRRLGS